MMAPFQTLDFQLRQYLIKMVGKFIVLSSDILRLSDIVTSVTLSTLNETYDILHDLRDKLSDLETELKDADEEYDELAMKGKCRENSMEENKRLLLRLWSMHAESTDGYLKLKLLLDVYEQAALFGGLGIENQGGSI